MKVCPFLCGAMIAGWLVGGEAQAQPQPPTDPIASVEGNVVTLRWHAPAAGAPAGGYVVEGGIGRGEVLGSFAATLPAVTFVAPPGAFYLRVYSVIDAQRSAPSDEIRIFVDTSEPPVAPEGLVATVNGSSLALAWRNPAQYGTPTGMALDVSGSVVASLALPRVNTFSVTDVPPGTYTIGVRALNAFGSSGVSNRVTVTLPGGCSGVPPPPENFSAYKAGAEIYAAWDPAANGPAATTFVLTVTGGFTATIPMSSRAVSGVVPAGTYMLSVAGANVCGVGSATAPQTVTVP